MYTYCYLSNVSYVWFLLVWFLAAAGGTGVFAVQLAKLKGNHVIGTCSSDDKVTKTNVHMFSKKKKKTYTKQ
jgi:NADPH-dependent curcumin reductase CurA